MFLALFNLFGCFGKKPPKPSFEAWLEQNFPGQFEVLSTSSNFNLKDYYLGKRTSLLADKSDPDVQFALRWLKSPPDFGLTKAEVQAALDSCRANVAQARALLNLLKTNGFDKISVSASGPNAYLMAFAEPTSAQRLETLAQLKTALAGQPDWAERTFWVMLMEPTAYQTEFRDIIPGWHWERPDGWQRNKCIMENQINDLRQPIAALMRGWTVSTVSDHTEVFRAEAHRQALVWAEKKLPKPFYLEPAHLVQMERDERDPLAIHYHFPVHPTQPDSLEGTVENSIIGYVSGIYQTDDKTFTRIKHQKEL
jgi:hypothetical protein